jgi:hypothetical protein
MFRFCKREKPSTKTRITLIDTIILINKELSAFTLTVTMCIVNGPGTVRGSIQRGDAEGEQPCTNDVVCCPHKPEVLKGHHLGGGDLKGRHIQGGTVSIDGLLQHPTLGHPVGAGRPLVIGGRKGLLIFHSAQQ